MPIYTVQDPNTGETVKLEGDSPPTEAELEQIFSQIRPQVPQAQVPAQIPVQQPQAIPKRRSQDPGFFETLAGEGQLAGSLATAIIAEPIAGLAGGFQALNPFADPGAGARAVEAVKGLAFKPGEAGRQVAGSIGEIAGAITPQPVKDFFTFIGKGFEDLKEATFQRFGAGAATAVATAPTAILEAVPALSAIKKARKIQVTNADNIIDGIGQATRNKGVDSIKTGIPPEIKTPDQIINDFRKAQGRGLGRITRGKARAEKRIIKQIDPDIETIEAAKDLGVDLNPGHYSSSLTFREVEQAISSKTGSELNKIQENAFKKTALEADNLINDLGGITDKSLFDKIVKDEINNNIKALKNQSDKMYKQVGEAIPNVTKVELEATKEYMQIVLGDLKGVKSRLSPAEKKVLELASDPNNVTYGAVDRLRRDIGNSIGSINAPFSNNDRRRLGELYDVLTDDQQGIADAMGIGETYEGARKLVHQRKQIEENALKIFQKDMQGSILGKLSGAATGLTKGDTSQFIKLLDAVPENMRELASVGMLNEIFNVGARVNVGLSEGFPKAFAALNRNKVAKKELFKHLPPGAEKKFNNIGIVTTGILRSKALANKSKSARDAAALLQGGGHISKAVDFAAMGLFTSQIATSFGAGSAVAGTSALIAPIIWNKIFKRGEAIEAANNLLTSPAFKKSIEDFARGKSGEGIKQAPVYRRWIKEQTQAAQAEIAAIGFVPFMLGPAELDLSEPDPFQGGGQEVNNGIQR